MRQGEGGVNIPAEGFLQGLRQLCDERNCLLIFDEVQTGMGRTGTWFGYQQWGVQPDIMTLAKGLAAGVACGAFMATDAVAPSEWGGTQVHGDVDRLRLDDTDAV